jgi:hypothetical protein
MRPALAVWLAMAPAYAQVTASISGNVQDATGGVINGATVTVKNVETGAVRVVSTDESGNYRAVSLPLGLQEVKAEKAGFQSALRTGVNLDVGSRSVKSRRLLRCWMKRRW